MSEWKKKIAEAKWKYPWLSDDDLDLCTTAIERTSLTEQEKEERLPKCLTELADLKKQQESERKEERKKAPNDKLRGEFDNWHKWESWKDRLQKAHEVANARTEAIRPQELELDDPFANKSLNKGFKTWSVSGVYPKSEGYKRDSQDSIIIPYLTEKNKAKGIFQTPKNEKTEHTLTVIKANVQCKDCGWTTETEDLKTAKEFRRKEISCPDCGSTRFKMKDVFPYKMKSIYFTSEEEVRSAVMNALYNFGVRLWDCSSERHLCREQIFIEHIPLRILTGDFLFSSNNRFYICEIKFHKFKKCSFFKKRNRYFANRGGLMIYDDQSKMLLEGEGVLLIVVEPTPTSLGESGLSGDNLKECEERLERGWRIPLGNNKILYEIFIMNQRIFSKYWSEYLKKKPSHSLGDKTYKVFSFKEARKLVKESYFQLSKKEILGGKIANLILNSLINKEIF